MINLGLSSETCSGLSEPAHPFPCPNVHERLGRALDRLKPDVAVACYGVNDAIYHPFSEANFAAFKSGINRLIEAHAAAKIPLNLMTPPPFDPLPMRKKGRLQNADAGEYSWTKIYKNYDSEVMKRYADWMKTIDHPNCLVVDIYTPISKDLAARRKSDADFSYSNDGVHIDAIGHRVLGESLAEGLGLGDLPKDETVLANVSKRSAVMHKAWLSHVGHKRPGVPAGLPLDQARENAAPFSAAIQQRLTK
jgi:lysophospholipase L1-like esterase